MKITNKTLYKVLEPMDFKNTLNNMNLSKLLLEFLKVNGGIGLAANQVGYDKRMFVMRVNSPKVCCNPVVISKSEETEIEAEGCLSFKGEYIPIDRPTNIDVQYQTAAGLVIKETLQGLEARCFLHELDHLDGITMHKRKKLNESTRTTKKEFNN